MIKGRFYLKYLKQSLIGLGISFFMVLGGSYVNAGKVGYIGVEEDSTLNDSYSVKVNGNGLLYTNYLGLGKAMLQFGDGVYFFWSNNNYPYIYITSDSNNPTTHTTQGFVNSYLICDYIGMNTGDNVGLSNCTKYNINDGNFENVGQRYLQSLSNNGYFYYDIFQFNNNPRNAYCGTLTVCFSSSEFNKSMCFVGSNGAMSRPCNEYNANIFNLYSTDTNLVSGLDLSPYFDNVPISLLGNGFGFTSGGGNNISGGSYEGESNIITGNTVSLECSKNRALEWYRCNGYKSRMCYSSFGNNTEILQSGQSAVGFDFTGTDILDVWFDTWDYRRNGLTGESMGYENWFSYWRNTYDVYKRNPQHTNPFYGVPVSLFTLMGNVDVYGKPYTNQSVLEFCDLALYTSDLNSEYTGVAYNSVCNMSAIDIVDCHTYNTLHPEDGTPVDQSQGTVGPVGSSWDGITNRPGFHTISGEVASGDLNLISDGKTFTNNFFSLLSRSFQYPDTTGTGILPGFILIALCGLVFFRFISH